MTLPPCAPDLEEDYEAIYTTGARPDPYGGERTIPVGQCRRMCSYVEIQEREKHHRLSKYEVKPGTHPPEVDFSKVIKEFKRSCVGREFTKVEDLRPWSVLKQTLHYLLLDICTIEDDDWMYICDFVFDRLKAVRQDAVIQRIEGKRYVEILEGSVRFLIYSMYKLTCTLKDYVYECDIPYKNVIPLEGPVKGLDNREMHIVREMKLTMQCVRDCLSSLLIQYQENVPESTNRALFESLNLIVNLPFLHGRMSNPTDYQSHSDLRNKDGTFRTVFRMYCDHLNGFHMTAIKRLPDLTKEPLLVLAYAPALAQLQWTQIKMLKKLYAATGSSTSSIDHLCKFVCPKWLSDDEDEHARFARFVATQFGFYEEERQLCNYKLNRARSPSPPPPRDFVEKALQDRRRAMKQQQESGSDNETRIYALQMIMGRNWAMFSDLLENYGLTKLLDPSQD